MSLWKFNNVELEIDMADVEFQEKYEKAFDKMSAAEKNLKKTGKLSELSRGYCDMFYNLFDDLFGPGTSEKMFQKRYNVRDCDKAYDSFMKECKRQVTEINKSRARIYGRYKVKK